MDIAYAIFGALCCIIASIGLLRYLRRLTAQSETDDAKVKNESVLDTNNSSNAESKCKLLKDASKKCPFPDCIRCSRNREILTTAATKLSYYSDQENGAANSDRTNTLTSLVTNINKAIAVLKSPDIVVEDNDPLTKQKKSTPIVLHLSGLRENEFWSKHDIKGLQGLEVSFHKIQEEFHQLYTKLCEEDKDKWSSVLKCNETSGGKWDIALLVDQGVTREAAQMCPNTMAAVRGIPGLLTDCVFGDVSFSVVHPGTNITTHCGTTNVRIRCHLGLKVPSGKQCELKVRDQTAHWQEGDVLCFNDAHPHSVHHRGDNPQDFRAVLLVDVWHPDLTALQREMMGFAFSV